MLVSKPAWHRAATGDRVGYSIHFEPQFDLLKSRMNVFLHYETNPYLTQRQARTELPAPAFRRHLDRKERFRVALAAARPEGLRMSGHPNQNCKLEVDWGYGEMCAEVLRMQHD